MCSALEEEAGEGTDVVPCVGIVATCVHITVGTRSGHDSAEQVAVVWCCWPALVG